MLNKSATSVSSVWVQDRVRRHFFITAMLPLAVALFLIAVDPAGRGVHLCTLWGLATLMVSLGAVFLPPGGLLGFTHFVQFLLLGFSVLVFFDGANQVNRRRVEFNEHFVQDAELLAVDQALLGWAFPDGQLALWLQSWGFYSTLFGRFCVEILQVLYVSYYLWGNGLLAYLGLYQYFYLSLLRGRPPAKLSLQWRRLQMLFTAWVFTYMLNFLLNVAVPAASPRIYMLEKFSGDLEGLFIGTSLRQAVSKGATRTFSAFPSGHCGLSTVAAVMAHRVLGSCRTTNVFRGAAAAIVSATVVLRYHYVADVLAAIPMVACGLWWSGLHTEDSFSSLLHSHSRRLRPAKQASSV